MDLIDIRLIISLIRSPNSPNIPESFKISRNDQLSPKVSKSPQLIFDPEALGVSSGGWTHNLLPGSLFLWKKDNYSTYLKIKGLLLGSM